MRPWRAELNVLLSHACPCSGVPGADQLSVWPVDTVMQGAVATPTARCSPHAHAGAMTSMQ